MMEIFVYQHLKLYIYGVPTNMASIMRTNTLFSLSVALIVMLSSCVRGKEAAVQPQGTVVALDNVTSLGVAADSLSLWVGTSDDAFYNVVPSGGTVTRYNFPNPDHDITYCIFQVDRNRFMVATRNSGVALIDYGEGGDGVSAPAVRHIVMPGGSYPVKGSRYSAYNIVRADSLIFLGSSNGLAYLSIHDISQRGIAGDTITCRYVMPVKHLRDNRLQFSQEAIFPRSDHLIAVTDNGLFTIGYDKVATDDPAAAVLIDSGRYWSAEIAPDTLFALRTDIANPSAYQLCAYPLPLSSGTRPAVRTADASAAGLGRYNGRVVALNSADMALPPADYHLRHSNAEIGGMFYYIKSGRLMCVRSDRSTDDLNAEHITVDIGTHVLTDRHGIWRRDGDEFSFIGEILNPVAVKCATYSEVTDSIYIASHSGIYAVSAARTLLPSDRRLVLAYPNTPGDADRVESILADGETMYIGSRNGLKSIDLKNRTVRPYGFGYLADIYESPYVSSIALDESGSPVVGTLNFGAWRLEKDSGILTQIGDSPSEPDRGDVGKAVTATRGVTWQQVRRSAWVISLIFCALIGAVTVLVWIARRIHKRHLRQMRMAVTGRYAKIAGQLDDYIERHKDDDRYGRIADVIKPVAAALHLFCSDPCDQTRIPADKAVMRMTGTLKKEVVDNAVELVSSFPEAVAATDDDLNKRLSGIMVDFRKSVLELTSDGDTARAEDVITLSFKLFDLYCGFIAEASDALKAIHGSAMPVDREFMPDALAKLWETAMLLDVTGAIDTDIFPIYKCNSFDANGIDIEGYCGRMVFVTLLFYNQAKPSVKGYDSRDLRYVTRAVYNFNTKPDKRKYNNHGSAYKIIVRAMSDGYALCDDTNKPLVNVRLMDIVWDHYLSRRTADIASLRPDPNQVKSLYQAIRGAAHLAELRLLPKMPS